ncbi:selenium metabolism-associated LysR family transcriptional regulator [Candidatus Magnetomonas plexicatena]|uniref:selenium metabolism-associated LysR family transcriptional regulator n=1 Tax=Candidatus Magnetomonas plexicatena TaxID=2552947 RepID=UPI001C7782DD|nr:LysR family transcriptional regulator [Nitrospirales bacterium LBB_01]
MEDYKLRVFCTVAELKSFSKASEIIHLTQPAVSAQIQVIEENYGTKLFERTTNSTSLTPAGEILYRYAKDILSLYGDAEKKICKITGVTKGSIRVGASLTIGNYLIPQIIADFMKINPRARINLKIGNTKKIVDMINTSSIDIGFVESDMKGQKFIVEKVYDDELFFVVSSQHKLSSEPSVTLETIMKEPVIVREEGSGTRLAIEQFFIKKGLSIQNLRTFLITDSVEAIKECLYAGVGGSFLSKLVVHRDVANGGLKALKIKDERILRDMSLIYRKKNISSHVVEEFHSFIKNYKYSELYTE